MLGNVVDSLCGSVEISCPLVSVLIPAYNHEKYIEQAIKSVIGQSYGNWELIIVDDCSSDDTYSKAVRIVSELKGSYRLRCKVYRNDQNLGISKNFHKAFELSAGEYITFMASDNYMHREFIKVCMKYLMGDDARDAFVFTDYALLQENGEFLKERNLSFFGEGALDRKKILEGLLYSFTPKSCMPPVPFVVNRGVFEKVGRITPGLYMEDLDLYIRVSARSKFYRVPGVFFYFRVIKDSAGRIGGKVYEGRVATIEENKLLVGDGYDKALSVADIWAAIHCAVARDPMGAVRHLRRAYTVYGRGYFILKSFTYVLWVFLKAFVKPFLYPVIIRARSIFHF